MKMRKFVQSCCVCCVAVLLLGCVTQSAIQEKSSGIALPELTQRGTIVFNGEYEFTPPPAPWEMITGTKTTHYIFAFYRKDQEKGQVASTFFAYDEEPFGFSRNLEERAQECLKRYFSSSMLQVTILDQKKVHILGGDGLAVTFEGKDKIKKVKVKSKLLFGHRGERVVAFYINQWRSFDGSYDSNAFEIFDAFASNFVYLKKSFYETL